ncbi:MAG: hypothetical protein PSN34_15185 [Urechidicola sp.]|nr:hypothetical protein [Urechidicola sp.]
MGVIKDFAFNKLKYGYFFKKRLKHIRSLYELTPEQLLILENQMLVKQISNAYKKSTFYNALYNKHDINLSQIQSKEDLKLLPIIDKNDIKEFVDRIYIGSKFKHASHTSGTSGTPLKVYYDINCIINEASYNEIFRNNAGHYYGNKVLSLRGALDGSTKEYFDKFNNILYLSSYHLKQENVNWYYNKIKDFGPNCILAYPSSLETLAMLFENNNLQLKIPLTFTSSETLYLHQQEKIESTLNTKIYDRYGNAERTISLVQKSHMGVYHFPKLYSVNEFLKKEEIITTNLINPSFPLIRYQVDDILNISNNIVESIGGRVDDFLITPDGLRIGSAAMSLAFKKVDNLLMAQIIQDTKEEIKVLIVTNNLFSRKDEFFLLSKIRQKVGDIIIINLIKVNITQIHKTKANKYKLIINNL